MIRSIVPGLHAALLLARGRGDAVAGFGADDAMAAARRSFWAAPLCVPAFICLHLLDRQQAAAAGAAHGFAVDTAHSFTMDTAHSFAVDLVGFVIGWVAFSLVSLELARGLGRQRQWPQFIALWNWCNLVQYFMFVAAALPTLLGLPEIVGQTAGLAAVGWALWLEWFMTGLALEISGPLAAGLVAMDAAIGLFIAGLSGSVG